MRITVNTMCLVLETPYFLPFFLLSLPLSFSPFLFSLFSFLLSPLSSQKNDDGRRFAAPPGRDGTGNKVPERAAARHKRNNGTAGRYEVAGATDTETETERQVRSRGVRGGKARYKVAGATETARQKGPRPGPR